MKRSKKLRKLGFKSYPAYLKSDLWKDIKSRLLGADVRCVVCEQDAETLHHRDYNYHTLSGKDCSTLEPICFQCHRLIEFYIGGEKRMGLGVVNYLLDSLIQPCWRMGKRR